MADNVFTMRRVVAASLAGLLLLQVKAVSAGLFTTESALANFSFIGATVNYDPDPGLLTLYSDTAVSGDPSLTGDASSSSGRSSRDPLSGSLHLTAKIDNLGNLQSGDVNIFGSLPPATFFGPLELLKGSLTAVTADGLGRGSLAFMIDQRSVSGPLAYLYRSAGVFVLVDGVDEVSWINGFKDAAATIELVSLEDASINGDIGARNVGVAVPIPGTLVLLIAGIPLLLRRRISQH